MYKGLLHLHTTSVVLYLLLFTIKILLLLSANENTRNKFKSRKWVVWSERVLPLIFLITGVFLITEGQEGITSKPYFIAKMLAIVASIPLGIIALKRDLKGMGVISLLLLVLSFAWGKTRSLTLSNGNEIKAPTPDPTVSSYNGEGLFNSNKYNCTTCHGPGGDKGLSGATNLKKSTLTDEEIRSVIVHGKGLMPALAGIENDPKALDALIQHVKSLRGQPETPPAKEE